jgi:hypothetical protein
VFSSRTFATDFTENEEGRAEIREIPEAIDPKNLDVTNEEDKYLVYYFIDGIECRFCWPRRVELTIHFSLRQNPIDPTMRRFLNSTNSRGNSR